MNIIYNQNATASIRAYLLIEEESWNDFWTANHLTVRKVQAEANLLGCEYCLTRDFGSIRYGVYQKEIGAFTLYKTLDIPTEV